MIRDDKLIEVFLRPVRKCAEYRPAFGLGKRGGLAVAEFQELYGADEFYSWLGLDSDRVYAAHRAAGGLTSVYRQIGIGAERMFGAIVSGCLGLSVDEMSWSYDYPKGRGKTGTHTLDARIRVVDAAEEAQPRIDQWLEDALDYVNLDDSAHAEVHGAAFEVRQGYKSADSKRQNADLRFGINAYRASLLPVFAIFSAQVSEPVVRRYRSDGMLVLTGVTSDDPTISTFAFVEQVVGFDLLGFFARNRDQVRDEIQEIVSTLLSAE